MIYKMLSNNIKFSDVNGIVLENIPGLRSFFNLHYCEEELEMQYAIFSALSWFVKENYLDENFLPRPGKEGDLEFLYKLLNDLYINGDKNTGDLVAVGFLENFMGSGDLKKQENFKKNLKYDDLISCYEELCNGWYGNKKA